MLFIIILIHLQLQTLKQPEIVQHPNDPNKLALFLNESFHLIEEEDALFSSEATANKAFNDMYGDLL
jgi:transcriptional regulator of the spore photoproduct lyase operon